MTSSEERAVPETAPAPPGLDEAKAAPTAKATAYQLVVRESDEVLDVDEWVRRYVAFVLHLPEQ